MVTVAKAPSTPDPIDGVLRGIEARRSASTRSRCSRTGPRSRRMRLITRDLPSAAMVTTKGFRDVIEIGAAGRTSCGTRTTWRRRTSGGAIASRSRKGRLLGAGARAARRGGGTVARPKAEAARGLVCRGLLRELLRQSGARAEDETSSTAELPDARISLSSDILPEIFEHERFSTTVANAVLAPIVGNYVRQLEERLVAGGYDGDLLILHSGGGVMTSKTVERLAVRLASSGIAAGAIASRHLANLAGFKALDRARHGRDEHGHLPWSMTGCRG